MTRAFHGEGLIVRLIITLVGAFVIALGAIGTAQGDPFNEGSLTVTLYNCTGPAGTPSTMEGTRMPNGSNPLHLLDGTGTFVRTSIYDTVLDVLIVWGLTNNDRPLVTCNVVSTRTGNVSVVTGFITPVGDGGE